MRNGKADYYKGGVCYKADCRGEGGNCRGERRLDRSVNFEIKGNRIIRAEGRSPTAERELLQLPKPILPVGRSLDPSRSLPWELLLHQRQDFCHGPWQEIWLLQSCVLSGETPKWSSERMRWALRFAEYGVIAPTTPGWVEKSSNWNFTLWKDYNWEQDQALINMHMLYLYITHRSLILLRSHRRSWRPTYIKRKDTYGKNLKNKSTRFFCIFMWI